MKYKLVAVDIDGTLLNDEGIMTQKTIDSIKKAVKKGILFVLCTGRPIQGVKNYYEILDLDSPIITYNGAMVVMSKSKEILYEQTLSVNGARNILNLGKKLKTNMIVWSNNQLYVYEVNEKINEYKKISNIEPILIDQDEKKIIQQGITKIIWHDNIDKINSYLHILENEKEKEFSYYTSRPIFLEFVNNNISKAFAMEKIGECFQIKQEEMIAIGDGFNDLPMIEWAGMGVAMGNAPIEIKEKADYITLSNEEDGVAYVLDKFI